MRSALNYLNESVPGITTQALADAGVLDSLLQYHVTAGNAALTADRLRNNMMLTMLNKEKTAILV